MNNVHSSATHLANARMLILQLQFILSSSSPFHVKENKIKSNQTGVSFSLIFSEYFFKRRNKNSFTTKCSAQIINIIKTTHEKCTK